MSQYHCQILVSLAYNLAWSENQAEVDRLRKALHQIDPRPAAINEPTEAELLALDIDVFPGAFLKVAYLIEAETPDDAAVSLRRIVDRINAQNQPAWWFLRALPVEAK